MKRLERMKFKLEEERKKVKYLRREINNKDKIIKSIFKSRENVFGELLTLSNRIFENDNIVTILRGFFTDYYRISNKMRRVTQNHIRKSNHIGFY